MEVSPNRKATFEPLKANTSVCVRVHVCVCVCNVSESERERGCNLEKEENPGSLLEAPVNLLCILQGDSDWVG